MNFRDYKWFKNPRGLHNVGVFRPFEIERWIDTHMGWAKFVAGGNEYAPAASGLAANNCMTIIRIFRENMGALKPPDVWYENYKDYVNNGCYWFELYNEPNLEGEWPRAGTGVSVYVDWANVDEVIAPMMDNWIEWAEKVVDLGGYPGFPALSDSADHRHATVFWQDAFLRYLKDKYNTRFRKVIANGLWCATHPYIANHFYQEPPGGPAHVGRPYYQEDWQGPGWHFEYPYDPLQQSHDPGRTVFGGTELTPYGDPNGLIASGQSFQELLSRYFDAGPVPVVGTEGGIWTIPKKGEDPLPIDTRYPPYSHESHAQATMAMWKWIVEKGPPWFWGVTLWNESDYFDIQGLTDATLLMMQEEPLLKEVPSIDTGGGVVSETVPELPEEPAATPTPTGPGPVSGDPDQHWLVLAPGLQADWFFLAAQRYWQTFRPTVMTDWDLIEQIPGNKSLAITVLARKDTISYLNERVRDTWSNVFYDPVVFDSLAEMKEELDRRATYQKRFG